MHARITDSRPRFSAAGAGTHQLRERPCATATTAAATTAPAVPPDHTSACRMRLLPPPTSASRSNRLPSGCRCLAALDLLTFCEPEQLLVLLPLAAPAALLGPAVCDTPSSSPASSPASAPGALLVSCACSCACSCSSCWPRSVFRVSISVSSATCVSSNSSRTRGQTIVNDQQTLPKARQKGHNAVMRGCDGG